MARLGSGTLDMILSTLAKYAERKLPADYLLALDHDDEFPRKVLAELYDPAKLGLHLLFIPEDYGGGVGGARARAEIDALAASGRYWPVIGLEVPLTRADEAFAAMAAGTLVGKAVIRMR